jgi:tetratricopeptide (TPR) repeat protein
MLAAGAGAQATGDYADCVKGLGMASAVEACSRAIETGGLSKPKLANAYALRATGRMIAALTAAHASDAGAIDDYTQSIALAPSREALEGRGALYYNDQRYAAAAADFTKAAALDPKNGPDDHLGCALEHLGKAKEALAAYDGLVAHHRKDPQALMARGDFHLRAGRGDKAAADFAAALKLEPKGAYTHEYAELEYRLGLALRLKGDSKRAEAAFAKAKAIYPGIAVTIDNF